MRTSTRACAGSPARSFCFARFLSFLGVIFFGDLMVSLSSSVTQGPYFRTYGPYFRTSSKSLNGRKIARMAPILTIFGPNRSRRRDLFFEKFSNERRRHRRLVLVSSSPSSSPPSSPSSPSKIVGHPSLKTVLLASRHVLLVVKPDSAI